MLAGFCKKIFRSVCMIISNIFNCFKEDDKESKSPCTDKKSQKNKKKDEVTASSSKSKPCNESTDSSKESEDDNAVESIRKYMAEKLGFLDKKEKEQKKKVLDEVSVDGVVRYIKSGNCSNIVILAGAGISTSAGIPDFRSPGSGLYDNLSKYKLPHPQAIFEIDFFQENPEPFYTLAKELIPGSYKPTPAHHFVRLLHEKGLLLRHYTQNIDGLEKMAGVPPEKIVEAHGTFYSSHCLSCRKEYLLDWMREQIAKNLVPKCECGGLIKPDIVFFGENLPERFFKLVNSDFPKASLLLIMGSSLVVQPFASLVERVPNHVPRLLINREKAGHRSGIMAILGMGGCLDFDSDKNYRDVAWLGDCDDLVNQFVDKLDWRKEFDVICSASS